MSIVSINTDANISLVNLHKELEIINGKLNEIILNNRSLKKRISELNIEKNILVDLTYDMEIQMSNLNQYTRRSNIEISNISEKIVQRNLEGYVLKVFQSVGVNLLSYDLVAVHRMGKFVQGKTRNVIVRFVNRKNAFSCLRNAKKLAVSSTQEFKRL